MLILYPPFYFFRIIYPAYLSFCIEDNMGNPAVKGTGAIPLIIAGSSTRCISQADDGKGCISLGAKAPCFDSANKFIKNANEQEYGFYCKVLDYASDGFTTMEACQQIYQNCKSI